MFRDRKGNMCYKTQCHKKEENYCALNLGWNIIMCVCALTNVLLKHFGNIFYLIKDKPDFFSYSNLFKKRLPLY